MVLHLLALVKLKLLATASHSAFTPLVPCLAYPFVLKLCNSLRFGLPQSRASVAQFSGLFLFRLGRIIFHGRREEALGNAGRWRRALRLIDEMISRATLQAGSQGSSGYGHSLNGIAVMAV
ncbi:hypothetical protein DCAR_0209587 [Daucus carota subsp. sativus]|uniref:Uncharacterized protein n=1 Tax=Daucus carota subsp. sativus TaxID=79200 RepID=A0A162AYH5_DAUCS|nr:hypothetical protein DCAR_0209587 [Daucus carota subsp. sativus]